MTDVKEVPFPRKEIDQIKISLIRDGEAESKLPGLLQGAPCYQAEQVLLSHNLRLDNFRLLGGNRGGIAFRIPVGEDQTPTLFKIFRGADVPKVVLGDFLQKTGIRHSPDARDSRGNPASKDQVMNFLDDRANLGPVLNRDILDEDVYREAAAYWVGHPKRPENIPALHGLWSFNGKLIGVSTEFIKGEPNSLFFLGMRKDLSAELKFLEENQIDCDDFHESNNVILKPDGIPSFIDLKYMGNLN